MVAAALWDLATRDGVVLQLEIEAIGPVPPVTISVEGGRATRLTRGRRTETLELAAGGRVVRDFTFDGQAATHDPIRIMIEGQDAGFGITATMQYPPIEPSPAPRFLRVATPVEIGGITIDQTIR
ncbi:MAG: hypothetical protein H0X17_15155 [Deltaproteobacteria bacterium]|nr:hypothetical protein [Deltaproteobacteria bacterium]